MYAYRCIYVCIIVFISLHPFHSHITAASPPAGELQQRHLALVQLFCKRPLQTVLDLHLSFPT